MKNKLLVSLISMSVFSAILMAAPFQMPENWVLPMRANNNALIADGVRDNVDSAVFVPPVITLTGQPSLSLANGDTYSEFGATCTDSIDGDIIVPAPSFSPSLDTNTNGTYVATYTCTDSQGLTDTVQRTVNVSDNAVEILFADSFDTHADYALSGSCRSQTDTDCQTVNMPLDDIYSAWHGQTVYDPGWTFLVASNGSNGAHTSGYITGGTAGPGACRGGSGKCFEAWDEVELERGGSQWGVESQLGKIFDTEYPEMWVRYYIKFRPDYPLSNQKILHLFHYDRSWHEGGSASSLTNTSESTDGGIIANFRKVTATEAEIRVSLRGSNPPAYKIGNGIFVVDENGTSWPGDGAGRFDMRTGPSCTVPADSWSYFINEDRWVKIEFGIRNSSAIGVADGEVEVWVDNCRLGLITGIPFKASGATNDHNGFNGFSIGGNAQPNDWGADDEERMIFHIDDVLVTTQRYPD